MENYSLRVMQKIIVLFFAMMAGYIAKKGKIIDVNATNKFSSLLVYITCPALIICSLQMQTNDGGELLIKAGFIFIMSFIIHLFFAVSSRFIFKGVKDKKSRGVYQYGYSYHNCAYMGYPIMEAIFPEEGLFYGVIFVTVFNLFNWSHGLYVMSGKSGLSLKRIVTNPSLMSVFISIFMFLTNLKLPQVVFEGLDLVGDMTFPLAMVIIGSLLADMKLSTIFKKKEVYLFSLLTLVISPLLMLAIAYIFNLPQYLAITGVTMCAAPVAANTAVTAEVYNNNSALAARLVGVTTLFCLGTIPAILWLTQTIL